ncbi:MAG: hypothetical protein ACI4I9_00020 [Porcipelethomonas sp.]
MKHTKRIICIITASIMCAGLFGCGSDNSDANVPASEIDETEEKTYNIDSSYKFKDISLRISDEWECEETSNSCTITCPEDNSFMCVSVYDMSGFSDPNEIYESFSSVEDCKDISKLQVYNDYSLYTFSFTQDPIGLVECYFFIYNELIYFISIPETPYDKDSIIYKNLNDVLRSVKSLLRINKIIEE